MTEHYATRRLLVMLAVAAIHALLLLLARSVVTDEPQPVEASSQSSVLFFQEEVRDSRGSAVNRPAVALNRAWNAANPVVVQDAPNLSIDVPRQTTEPAPAIDWQQEATQAATAGVDKAIGLERRKCDPSATPDSFLHRCTPPKQDFDWNPEEPTVGFSGGLPYVRIGEYCVVGLGFFGCAFGKPPANGKLFDQMREPDRNRSSVPEP